MAGVPRSDLPRKEKFARARAVHSPNGQVLHELVDGDLVQQNEIADSGLVSGGHGAGYGVGLRTKTAGKKKTNHSRYYSLRRWFLNAGPGSRREHRRDAFDSRRCRGSRSNCCCLL